MDFYFIELETREYYIALCTVIDDLNLWNALESDTCFNNSELMEKIFNKVRAYDDTSTSCVVMYSKILLHMQYIAQYGYDKFKIKYIKHYRKDIINVVKVIEKNILECMINPRYLYCKKRLLKQFELDAISTEN